MVYFSDDEVTTDACWALSYLTDGTDDKIEEVVNSGVVPRLIQLLGSSVMSILTPALRAVGNIVTGNDHQVCFVVLVLFCCGHVFLNSLLIVQTQSVIDGGGLRAFHKLLTHPKSNIQKETAWSISNITAGSILQIQAVIDSELLVPLKEVLDKVSCEHTIHASQLCLTVFGLT